MSFNNRIFYACQAVVIVPKTGDPVQTKGIAVRGLQSVGMSSTFNLEQVFELGQIEIYENIEEVADIEVTLEKAIDGRALIYQLASNGECANNISAAAKNRCDVFLTIFTDANDSIATTAPMNICWNSGMYTSSVSYSYSVDGSATESVTLVGNDRFWNTVKEPTGGVSANVHFGTGVAPFAGLDNSDTPLSGVQRRVDVLVNTSTLPAIVKSQVGADSDSKHIQSISISTDFSQENILELGRFGPYARYATFPVEVTAEFEVIATSGDLVSVSGNTRNLGDGEPIKILDSAGTVIDLGSNCKLSSVSYSGGDTGGGNASVSYSFNTYNSLLVDGGNAANAEDNAEGTATTRTT